MKLTRVLSLAACNLVYFLIAFSGWAADYPSPREGDWVLRDFRFHTGEVLPELRLHYVTVGAPTGESVLILHGTGGAGTNMLTGDFAGELFGPGQPLDASRYFIILPDAIGAGKSSKPSDGLRTRFPQYNYDDMVRAQHRLITEHLSERLARPSSADANDLLYQYAASRDYNPMPKLESIKARLLAINSADDERNPAELGIMEREIKRVKHGQYVLIPANDEMRGHGTTSSAKWWKRYLVELLQPVAQAAK